MAPTNVELYEALRPTVGEDAARMMAEAWPAASDLATKTDVADFRAEVRAGFAEVRAEFAAVRGEMHAGSASTMRWMLTFFIPVWAGTWATTLAVILKS